MCPGLCGQCRDVLCRDTGTYQNFHAVPCPLHQSAEKLRSLWGTRRLPAGEDGTKAHAPDRFQCRKGVGADIKGTVQGTRHRTACLFRCPARRRINGPHGLRIQLPFRGQHTGHDTIRPSLHQLCGQLFHLGKLVAVVTEISEPGPQQSAHRQAGLRLDLTHQRKAGRCTAHDQVGTQFQPAGTAALCCQCTGSAVHTYFQNRTHFNSSLFAGP